MISRRFTKMWSERMRSGYILCSLDVLESFSYYKNNTNSRLRLVVTRDSCLTVSDWVSLKRHETVSWLNTIGEWQIFCLTAERFLTGFFRDSWQNNTTKEFLSWVIKFQIGLVGGFKGKSLLNSKKLHIFLPLTDDWRHLLGHLWLGSEHRYRVLWLQNQLFWEMPLNITSCWPITAGTKTLSRGGHAFWFDNVKRKVM